MAMWTNAKRYGLGAVVLCGLGFAALPAAAQQAPPNGGDQELVTRLHQLGQDEIAMAGLGETRGVRAQVQGFAATVARDRRAADNGLIAYAQRKNMNLPTVALPGGALEHSTLATARLANLPRDDFDYNFTAQMVADHQAALDAATAAERLARDPELKAIIDDNLKMLTERLVVAQELAAGIPAPAPRALQLPAYPISPSRTRTGADVPPPAAFVR